MTSGENGFYRCGGDPIRDRKRGPRLRHRTIDLHCHMVVPGVEALVADTPGKRADQAASVATFGAASIEMNARQFQVVGPKLARLDERLADMDAMGVDIQVVSVSPTQYCYWADEELSLALVRTANDALAEACAANPKRLLGLATVSLQHPAAAAEQLEHAMKQLGLRGVEISSHVNCESLAERRFDPFWKKADELGAVVFIHPWGTNVGDRLSRHYLGNTVGQPMETTIALSQLIFGGTLDRHAGLKIVAAHGGGYLPLYISRSDHAHTHRPDAAGCNCRPSEYLRRIWFDSLVYDPRHLDRLIEVVGASQLVLGTDYPFDMGDYDPAALLGHLADDVQAAIAGGNAAALLGIGEQE